MICEYCYVAAYPDCDLEEELQKVEQPDHYVKCEKCGGETRSGLQDPPSKSDEERLNEILFEWETRMQTRMPFYPPLQQRLLALLRDVRKEENEACAKIALGQGEPWSGMEEYVEKIRARLTAQDAGEA